jgi:uncharacterized protein YndB with AHSA1/START domain
VWEALTVPEKITAWFTPCNEVLLELKPGGQAVFAGGSEDASYHSDGVVLDVIEGKKLLHTVLEGHEPTWYGALLWSLEESGEGTRLTLAETGFQGREEELTGFEEDWRALLISLCHFLEDPEGPDRTEGLYEASGRQLASSFGYSYAPAKTCWERILALHGTPSAPEVHGPCALIGDHAPARPGKVLDVIDGRKLMYTWPEDGWDAVACWLLEDMGSETKISLERWGYEHRPDSLTKAQDACDEIMDRVVAGLDTIAPEYAAYEAPEMEGYEESDMEESGDTEEEEQFDQD